MIVNVCLAATSTAPRERIWSVLAAPEKFDEWTDARFVSAEPAGLLEPGQVIQLSGSGLGRWLPIRFVVGDVDPQHGSVDVIVYLPFGIENHEHITLTETKEGGTLVRFN